MTETTKTDILLNLANLTEKMEEANKIVQYIGEQIQKEEPISS